MAAGRPRPTVVPLSPPTLSIVLREGASVRSRLLGLALRLTVKPMLATWSHLPLTSWPTDIIDRAARVLPVPRGIEVGRVDLPTCRAETIRAAETEDDRAILYLHGGAFIVCGLNTHRAMVSRISAAAGATVLNVDYRMLPVMPISAAVADGLDGYRWLLDQGYDPAKIVIAGDSAGGYLTFMVALSILEADLPAPAGLVAMSPLTDMDPSRKLAHPNHRRCSVFPTSALTALNRLIDHVDARIVVDGEPGPTVSPVDADLEGMPPALIQVGSDEILLPDAELMAMRLASSDVPCELQIWEKQVHVFQAAARLIPEAGRATGEVGDFVRSVTSAAAASEVG